MKIKLLTLTTLTLSFLLSAPPIAWGKDCVMPTEYDFYTSSCLSCEEMGYKLAYQGGFINNALFCMDRNCAEPSPSDMIACQKCNSDYYVSGNICKFCPQGATCDGWTITCSDGTKMDLVVHPVIHRAKRVRGRKITTVLPATAELICPAVNVLTALPMRYVTARLIFLALRAISNQTANVSKMNPNRQRRTRSIPVRHA